jgi:ATP-dependent exoDNAse (exonuclease V) beta subunit
LLRALGLSAAADTKTRPAEAVVYEQGDPNWQPKLLEGSTAAPPPVPRPIRLSPPAAQPRRVEWVAPSGLEARRTGNLASLFADTDSTGRDIGTLHHAWFETITWLDDGEPSDEQLRARAAVIPYTRDDLDEQLRDFRQTLTRPEVRQALSKPSGAVPLRVDVERPFTVRDGPRLVNGIIDRLVWLKRADGTASAEVYDYKTDRVTDDTLHERVEHHRPQMEAYIRAVASFGALPPAAVTATLVFTRLGRTIRLHAPTA